MGILPLGYTRSRRFDERAIEAIREFGAQAARAFANARQARSSEKRSLQLAGLTRLCSSLRTAQTVDQMFAQLIEETQRTFAVESASIWLYDERHSKLRLDASRGFITPQAAHQVGQEIAESVFTSGKPHFSFDLQADPLYGDGQVRGALTGHAGIAVPIPTERGIVGTLFVTSRQRRHLTQAPQVLGVFAEVAGIAIHGTRLHEETTNQLQRMTALRDIDRAIAGSQDLRVTLHVILRQTTMQLHADAADVLLLDLSTNSLNYAEGCGLRTPAMRNLRLPLYEGYAGQAAFQGEPVCIPSLSVVDANGPQASLLRNEGFLSYYGVPLVAKGQVKGVLEVFNRMTLEANAEWLEYLEMLAGQAAIAIDSYELFEHLQRSHADLIQAYDTTIEGWSRAMDLRDQDTEGHTRRVTEMTEQLARALGVPERDLVHMRRGALLHDIGKIGVPDCILNKPGPLSAEEWQVMRQHPRLALELLSTIGYLRPALDIPYSHHEKWDGTGYPENLKGERIPLSARIFSVVDVWDALRSDRPYRPAWTSEQARAYIQEGSGKHFDPQVVKAFIEMIDREEIKL